MRTIKTMPARNWILPFALLLMATTLGGCVGYTSYPPGYYGYNTYTTPTGYYSGYPATYAYSYNAPAPLYTSNYNGYYNTYGTTAGNGR